MSPAHEIAVEKIAALLAALGVGEILSYADASKAAGLDLRSAARWLLLRARANVEKERPDVRFTTERGQGVRRLAADEIPGIGAAARRSIRRKARIGYRRLADQKMNLSPQDQARVDLERSILGAVITVSRDATLKKAATGERTGPLTLADLAARLAG